MSGSIASATSRWISSDVQRVADRRPLHLGVEDNRHDLARVRALVDVNVADADAAGDDRDGGVFQGELRAARPRRAG